MCDAGIISYLQEIVNIRNKAKRKKKHLKIDASKKGGEMMRAIDILFNEIDKINSQIKKEENNTDDKVMLAFEIGKIVEIIRGIQELQQGEFFPNFKCTRKKDYI